MGELNYRVSIFNRADKWCGSSSTPAETRALEEWRYLRHPGGRAELGAWDEGAREYVTYRELTDADLCAECGQLLEDRRRCLRCDEGRETPATLFTSLRELSEEAEREALAREASNADS